MTAPVSEPKLSSRPDGTLIMSCGEPLAVDPRTMVDWLEIWAQDRPDQVLVAQRDRNAGWRGLSYAEALGTSKRIAGQLLDLGATAERPVLILSGNSVAHAKVLLGCLYGGIPVAPVSPAYALMSKDFHRLSSVFTTLHPSVVYVEDAAPFAGALAAMRANFDFELLVLKASPAGDRMRARYLDARPSASAQRVALARRSVTPNAIAKVLFTSGSTGAPKGVINTHAMWCANQQQIAHAWPFLLDEPPVLLDWLPWNHTFGGNHNFGLVLRHGGTLYIDDGRATEADIGKTVRNLTEVSPTLFMNVPKGYDLLVPLLENDVRARRGLFCNLRFLMSAAAALPAHVADRLRALADMEGRDSIPIVTGWGSTETGPGVTLTPLEIHDSPGMGLPMRGIEIKMLTAAGETHRGLYELRVRGPNVTPGYWGRPELAAAIFDEDGFYRMGDLGRFVDPQRPELGIAFAGRTAEEFKLSSGTWVQTSAFRLRAIEAFAPLVQDAVVAGANRDFVAMLLFMNWRNCHDCVGPGGDHLSEAQLAAHPRIVEAIRRGMGLLAQGGGSSNSAARCLIEVDPPSMDKGEITDKGYLNQSAVLRHRADSVDRLYASPPEVGVIEMHVYRAATGAAARGSQLATSLS